MSVTTHAEFEELRPIDSRLKFEVFGNFTQRDVDGLKDEWFPNNAETRGELQDLWIRHPNRNGEKSSYLLFDISLSR